MSGSTGVRRAAVVLFDGFTVLDAYGPIQAFAACRRTQADGTVLRLFEIFTGRRSPGFVTSAEGPASRVDRTLADAPAWDVLAIPGGSGTRRLVQRLNGRELALAAARTMEYVWNEDPAEDPFA